MADPRQLLNGLNSQFVAFAQQGDYQQALRVANYALHIARGSLHSDDPMTATALHNLGMALYHQGKYAEARPYLEEALAARRKTLGEQHLVTAESLIDLGLLLKVTGDYAGARSHYEQALAVRKSVLGDDHPDTAQCLNNLGHLFGTMGDYVHARAYFERALEIVQKSLGDDHPFTLTARTNLGHLLETTGDYLAARTYYEQALEVRKRLLGEDHPETIQSLHHLGNLFQLIGNYESAGAYYSKALTAVKRVLGGEHPATAAILSALGTLYQSKGDYAHALPCFEQALHIEQTVFGEKHPHPATCLMNMGYLATLMADHGKALAYYRHAVSIFEETLGENHDHTAKSSILLAQELMVTGDYDGARTELELALGVIRKTLGEDHPDTAGALSNLGRLDRVTGNYNRAREYYERGLNVLHKTLGENNSLVARAMDNLGFLLAEMGEYAAARPYYERAMAVREEGLGTDADIARGLTHLAALNVATGRIDEAWSLLQQAETADNRVLGQVFSIASEDQRGDFLRALQENLHGLLSFALQHMQDEKRVVATVFDAVLRRKALGAEALAVQRDSVLRGHYPELRTKLEELFTLRTQIAKTTLQGPGREGVEAHQRMLGQWLAQKQQLESEVARHLPELKLERELRTVDRHGVASVLPEGSALVEFIKVGIVDFFAVPARGEPRWRPDRYLAFVLRAAEPDDVCIIDLGDAEVIDHLVASFRDVVAVTPQARRTAAPDSAVTLCGTLLDKLVPALAGHRRLFVAPDGDLNQLPFEVLSGPDGRLLIEDYEVSYLSCGRDLLRFGVRLDGRPRDAVVVADPAYNLTLEAVAAAAKDGTAAGEEAQRQSRDLDRGMRFGPLKRTREEGERVGEMLGVRPWLKADALEGRLKRARSPRILHLATHGFFLPDQSRDPNREVSTTIADAAEGLQRRLSGPGMENPLLRSGLALAGANVWLRGGKVPAEAEDGLLTAEDVTGMDLLETELVVLSACETGLGDVHVGEGVFGLRRAFVLAGAKRLVMSLWKVPDQQTFELMVDFYQRLLAGEGVAVALRSAQLTMRGRHTDPYFWAAFILLGDPGPLLRGTAAPRPRMA